MSVNKNRILFLGSLRGGGRERRMGQLIIGLQSYKEFEEYILLSSTEIQYREVETTGVPIEIMKATDRLGTIREIADVFERVKPDIVHCWAEMPRYLYALVFLKPIYKYKLIAGYVADGHKRPFFRRMMFSDILAYTFSEVVVANSMAGIVGRRVPRKKGVVIHNGFDFSRFSQDVDVEGKRNQLVKKDAFIVTMVARFDQMKDHELLLKVATIIQQLNKHIVFLLVGDGPLMEEYVELTKKNNISNIIFLGRRTDVESILLSSDASILLTKKNHGEGISNTIMESMAAGLPVIATNSGGTPEIIKDGVNGFLVPVDNADTPVQLLMTLEANRQYAKQIGLKAKEHIIENFQLTEMTKKYVDVYKKIIGNIDSNNRVV